jgi:recombination protein RecT
MTDKQIKPIEEKVIGEFTKNELDTLKGTIAKGTTNEQFQLFVQTCVNSGLNPFLNQVYCIVYGQNMSIQVSVEGIAHLARLKSGFKGYDVQVVCENDTFKVSKEGNELKISVHDICFPRGQVLGAYAVAYAEGKPDFVVLMDVSEVEAMKTGSNAKMWKPYFADMFKKHVLKRALKGQFGIEINEDEAIKPPSDIPAYERKEVEQEEITKDIQVDEETTISEEQLMQEHWDKIQELMYDTDFTNDDLKGLIAEKFNKKPQELTLQNLAALVKFVEFGVKSKPKGETPPAEEKTPEEPKDEMGEFENLFDLA